MDTDKRKLLSMACHASIFVNWTFVAFAIPIVAFFTVNDPIVKENAKESINFHINAYIYGAIIGILYALVITIPVAFVLSVFWGIAIIVSPILALLKVANNPDLPYRYAFIFRLL